MTANRKQATTGGKYREVTYLDSDERAALEQRASDERCSKAEILRRALRAYLWGKRKLPKQQ